jgi:chitodextrinase
MKILNGRIFNVAVALLLLTFCTVSAALASTLSGTVYGGSTPLSNAAVALTNAGTSVGSVTTDGNGAFSFAVSDGTYDLNISPPAGSVFGASVVKAISVHGADVIQNVVLVSEAIQLSGKVLTPGGVPVQKVEVVLANPANGGTIASAFTDANGSYSFPVGAGTYSMNLYGGSQFWGSCGADGITAQCVPNVPVPQTFYGYNVVQDLTVTGDIVQNITLPVVILSGKTTDSKGGPVGNVKISQSGGVAQPVGSYYLYNNSADYPITSDASGNYTLPLIAGNGYSLNLTPPAGSAVGQSIISGIDITANTVKDLVLNPTSILSGKVLTPGGTGIHNAQVILKNPATGDAVAQVFTDATGSYSFPVGGGSFSMNVYGGSEFWGSCGPDGSYAQCVPNVPAPQSFYGYDLVQNLTVTGDTVQDITLPIVTLTGKTIDSKGVPVANVTITQASYVWLMDGYYWVNNNTGNPVTSDASGNYTLSLIAGSGYSLTLTPPVGSGAGQSIISGMEVTADAEQNLTLSPANILSGKVLTSGGVGISNVQVVLKNPNTNEVAAQVLTDASGSYSFSVGGGTFAINVNGGSKFWGVCQPDGSYGVCPPNVPVPQIFYGYNMVPSLTLAGDTTQDIILPVVTLSGKTTDSNGVPVANVKVTQDNTVWKDGGYYWVFNNDGYDPIKSDASGNYSLSLMAGSGYSETITPPSASFGQTVINNITLSQDMLQNIILPYIDTTAPVILTGPVVTDSSDTSVTVAWTTNEPAKGRVLYGTNTPPVSGVDEATLTANHSMVVSGLSAGTSYYFQVTATDASGNGPATSKVISFTTKAVQDTTPPTIIDGPRVDYIDTTSAIISWSTNKASYGSVNYGLSGTSDGIAKDTILSSTHSVKITGLTSQTQYFFTVSSTDAAGHGPATSAVNSFTTLSVPDTTAPQVVGGPMVIAVTDNTATIQWDTDEPGTSGVSWNVNGTSYGLVQNPSLVSSHLVTVTGLAAGTTYNFTVSSIDAAGNGPSLKAGAPFTTTLAPDANPPVFTLSPLAKTVTDISATLFWKTDKGASAVVRYGTDPGALDQTDSSADLLTKTYRTLSNLAPGKTYYFQVTVTDLNGNSTTGKIGTFTTTTQPVTVPPIITAPATVAYSSDTAAMVKFSTDKPCNGLVRYGVASVGYTNQVSDPSGLVTDHLVNVTNLIPDTAYSVQVRCTDANGKTVVASAGSNLTWFADSGATLADSNPPSSTLGFTTQAQPDTTPPVIAPTPAASAITTTTALIAWNTDKLSDSQVFYGLPGQNTPRFAGDLTKVSSHAVTLTNLTPGTAYQFKVQSTDPSNNTATSAVYSFTTAAKADTTPPVISTISAAGASISRIHVTWSTDEPATTVVKYGISPANLNLQAVVTGLTTAHDLTLYNLVPGTTYYVAPISSDSSDNSAQGLTRSVTLAGAPPVLHTVTSSTGAGGAVTPATQQVYDGYQFSLAVLPDAGYLLNSITGCGGTLSGNSYTTAVITSDCQVSATFSVDPSYHPAAALTTKAYPAGGSYGQGSVLMVQLLASRPSAAIHYTTDGSTPTASSPVYSAPIPISGTKTIKYFAKDTVSTGSVNSSTYSYSTGSSTTGSFSGLKNGSKFTVLRSEAGGAFNAVTTNATGTDFTDSSALRPNTVYHYAVTSDTDPSQTVFMTVRTPMQNGWNIISVPYNTTGVSPATLFGGTVSAVYQWLPSGASPESSSQVMGSYRTLTSLTPGNGYFVKSNDSKTMVVYSGTPGPASATVTLNPGWTMIANPNTTNKTNIASTWLIDGKLLSEAVIASRIGGGVYWWNGTTYESWSIMGDNPQIEPWKGYWIVNIDSAPHTLTIQ